MKLKKEPPFPPRLSITSKLQIQELLYFKFAVKGWPQVVDSTFRFNDVLRICELQDINLYFDPKQKLLENHNTHFVNKSKHKETASKP